MAGASTVQRARDDVIIAARDYVAMTHGNVRGNAYQRRAAAREALRAAIEVLDVLHSNATSKKARRYGSEVTHD